MPNTSFYKNSPNNSIGSNANIAVKFRKAYKSYVNKNDPRIVLRNLNMTVPKGKIYGLLGSSGCGKTTLLNLIIGRKTLDSGELWVLKDGSQQINKTKPRIGFMPQETALSSEFSIYESMVYFGSMIGLMSDVIKLRLKYLVDLLSLPDINLKIKNLDVGEKRLVSFAIVLLGDPELFILDEPTVGLDPLLRETMWSHLIRITRGESVTVILTTHCIDDLKNADTIGYMRKGRLMAEESPQNILSRFETDSLETTFVKLSEIQDMVLIANNKTVFNNFGLETDYVARYIVGDCLTDKNRSHVRVSVWKNFLWILRNWPLIITLILIPVLECILLFISFGHAPFGLHVALVNYESNSSNCSRLSCNETILSCNYISYLTENFINLVPYESEEMAVNSVLTGTTYASIVFRHNYTAALKARMAEWQDASEWDVFNSIIDVSFDHSKPPIASLLRFYLDKTFTQYIHDYLEVCNIRRSEVVAPIQWKNSVPAMLRIGLIDFASPGILLTTVFLLPAGLTVLSVLVERNEGVFDRSLSTGVRPMEIFTSHVICDFVIMVAICLATLVGVMYFFKMSNNGSLALLALLVVCTGFCGMWFGYVISFICQRESCAIMVTLGAFIPLLCMSAILWPIEGMVKMLRPIAYVLPLTVPVESMRSIMHRGWGLSKPIVYLGFITIGLWTITFGLICFFIVRKIR